MTRVPPQSCCRDFPTRWVSRGLDPRLDREVGVLAFAVLLLLLVSNPPLPPTHRKNLVRDCSGSLCHPTRFLSGYCSYGLLLGHLLCWSYPMVWVLQKLMMGERDSSHHVNPWPPEDGVVGRFNVKDVELCVDVVWINSDRELNRVGRIRLAAVLSIETRLGIIIFRDDSGASSIQSRAFRKGC